MSADELLDRTAREIVAECGALADLLVAKSRQCGDSALSPRRIFSRADAVEQIKVRIDDKLSRIETMGADAADEDTVADLIGYLVLLRVAKRRGLSATMSHDALDGAGDGFAKECLQECPVCKAVTGLHYEFSGSCGFVECAGCGATGPCDDEAADPTCDVEAAFRAWNRRTTNEVGCPWCGCAHNLHGEGEHFEFVRCGGCDACWPANYGQTT